jgi:RNA polymerase sigma-70 factor, ECF subfamily
VAVTSANMAEDELSLATGALHGLTEGTAGVQQRRIAEAKQRLEAIVNDHFDALWRFLRHLGIPECDVDDGVQEVLVVLARRLSDIETGRERAFVFSTAVRVASTLRRARHRRRELGDDELADLADPDPGPEASLDVTRVRRQLDVVLDQLPTELRAIFVLYEIEELTMAEIATLLDLRAGTVASRLRRARKRFERRVRSFEAELMRKGSP